VHRLCHDVGQVTHDEDDQGLDDPCVLGELQEEGCQAPHDESDRLKIGSKQKGGII